VAGLDPLEIRRARSFESADPRSAAILGFAEAVVRGRGEVADTAFAAARDAGLTDSELSDIVGHVAVNVLSNYFNRAFQVDVDFPRVEPAETQAAA
jgi:alkylhydroperoxidase family enzyme